MIGFITSTDASVLHSLAATRTYAGASIAIIVSELGRSLTIVGLGACAMLLLAMRRHFTYAIGVFIAVATSGIGTLILKGLVARPRPPLEFAAYREVWWSFPSAHASMSLAFYGYLIFLVFSLTRSRIIRTIATALGIVLVLAISFSRLYLGVHYTSDVVGGLLLGAGCLWLAVWATRTYNH